MNSFVKLLLAAVVVLVVIQIVRPPIPTEPVTAEVQAPPEVRQILDKDCYSCHSNQRRLSWFDEIAPAYWLVRHDILNARAHLNFSTLGDHPAAAQKATLYEAVNMIRLGAMPLPQFVMLHPGAKVTQQELATLEVYLAPWRPALEAVPGGSAVPAASPAISLAAIQPEFNGLPFAPGFEGWKLISTTDRGDNNTFRFILGNDMAVKAAQSGGVSPWPDGAEFAKIAWQQRLGPDGLVHPGKFVQVELMLKNAVDYKSTEGWGWGRWRGTDLKPYGSDVGFVNECTGCHRPLRGNDYVYTLPISTAQVSPVEVFNNAAAALPASLPYQPLGWSPITLYVDQKTQTTATLYGNKRAIEAVRAAKTSPPDTAMGPAYSAGSVLALVTWAQRGDPHWFGARIPDAPLSVEFVEVSAAGQASGYRRFAGAHLAEEKDQSAAALRINFIEDLAPAWLP